jgi:hypothetical protein
MLQNISYPAVTYNQPAVSILLEGGYAAEFPPNPTDFTLLTGRMNIKGGKVVMKKIKVK